MIQYQLLHTIYQIKVHPLLHPFEYHLSSLPSNCRQLLLHQLGMNQHQNVHDIKLIKQIQQKYQSQKGDGYQHLSRIHHSEILLLIISNKEDIHCPTQYSIQSNPFHSGYK